MVNPKPYYLIAIDPYYGNIKLNSLTRTLDFGKGAKNCFHMRSAAALP